MAQWDKLHSERVTHVKDTCKKYNLTSTIGPKGLTLIYSQSNSLAYMSIPKIGSTFLKQMFMVLRQGAEHAEHIYSIMRKNVHIQTGGVYKKLDAKTLDNVLVLLPTRHPYTRLFSAFIDKVYLPNGRSLAAVVERTGDHRSACGTNAKFEDFLRYALSNKTGKILGDHYNSPYKSLSNVVCKLDNFMLVKQETLSTDVEYALRKVEVNQTEFNTIYSMMHERRIDATIPGIIQTIYSNGRSFLKACLPPAKFAYVIWKSFQIQGFLHNDIEFPEHEFTNNEALYSDPKYVTKMVLKYIAKKPLTSSESRVQRRDALLDAYKTVSPQLMTQIHETYAMDFEIFQYDKDINSLT